MYFILFPLLLSRRFFLRESAVSAAIFDGDLVLAHPQKNADNREIVVARAPP
jgi:SOS-response transcriptional repressor LexA